MTSIISRFVTKNALNINEIAPVLGHARLFSSIKGKKNTVPSSTMQLNRADTSGHLANLMEEIGKAEKRGAAGKVNKVPPTVAQSNGIHPNSYLAKLMEEITNIERRYKTNTVQPAVAEQKSNENVNEYDKEYDKYVGKDGYFMPGSPASQAIIKNLTKLMKEDEKVRKRSELPKIVTKITIVKSNKTQETHSEAERAKKLLREKFKDSKIEIE